MKRRIPVPAVVVAVLSCTAACLIPLVDPPLAPPRDVSAALATEWGHCVLAWKPAASVDGYQVESSAAAFRVVNSLYNDVPGDAKGVELNFGDWNPELATISVALRSIRGQQRSEPSEQVDCSLPIRPPRSVIAAIHARGVELTWNNGSFIATLFHIERSEIDNTGAPGIWSSIADLPKSDAFTGRHLDSTVAPGVAYAYRISGVRDRDRSAAVEVAAPVVGAPLRTTTIQLPLASYVTLDASGQYAFIDGSSQRGTRYTWGRDGSWTTIELTGVGYGAGVKFDASGLPHAVYGRLHSSGDAVQLVHGWWDGAQWLEEPIAERVGPDARFDLDASGIPVIILRSIPFKVEVATRVGATWTITALDQFKLTDDEFYWDHDVFGDREGAIHLVVRDVQRIRHVQYRAGVATSELVPTGSVAPALAGPLSGVAHDANHMAICFIVSNVANGESTDRASCVRKRPSGWGPVEPVGWLPFIGTNWTFSSALSPDGDRLALIAHAPTSYGWHLFRSDGGRPWNATIIESTRFRALGHDASGSLRVLSGGSDPHDPVTIGDYQLDIEPSSN